MDLSIEDFGFIIPNEIPDTSFPLASTVHSLEICIRSIHEEKTILSQDFYDVIIEFNHIIYEKLLEIINSNIVMSSNEKMLNTIFNNKNIAIVKNYSKDNKIYGVVDLNRRLSDFLNVYDWCKLYQLDVSCIDKITFDCIDSFIHKVSLSPSKQIVKFLNEDKNDDSKLDFNIFEKFYDILYNYWNYNAINSNKILFKSVFKAFTRVSKWKYDSLSPFAITHLQHALVNNKILAIIAAKFGLIKFLQVRSYDLHFSLSRFLSFIESCASDSSDIMELPFLGLICKPQVIKDCVSNSISIKIIPIPKPAGDVFESIIAAVFVDTGCDLVTTAKIFLPMFKDYIVHPKIYVMENYKDVCKNVIKTNSGEYQVILKNPDEDFEYIGIANTLDEAHIASCYCLMKSNEN
ncbi:hypothetical protein MXB_2747, partial [Myxobolus squamalis]